MNQRWRDHRDSYRPAGEPIRTADYEVAAIDDDSTAKAFVLKHHYAASYPAARWRFGLYRRGLLVGVSVFSHPMNDAVLRDFPGERRESTELGRFVLLDDVPANGETWFLGRCFDGLRRDGVVGVVSFSDPMPRQSATGDVVFGGHIGTIYQAHNGIYRGRGRAQKLLLLPDGAVFSHRAETKIKNRECGWRYASAQLVKYGASPLGESTDAAAWLAKWRPRLTRAVRHPGNHKYLWAVDKRARRHLPASLAYPKMERAA